MPSLVLGTVLGYPSGIFLVQSIVLGDVTCTVEATDRSPLVQRGCSEGRAERSLILWGGKTPTRGE